jgi:metal-responsive CopG/Arc/MetJ family transcriptional regulator
MRTIIDLPQDRVKELDALAREKDVSRAELIRRAIVFWLKSEHLPKAERAFGIWKSRGEDALAYEDRLRNEWSRE